MRPIGTPLDDVAPAAASRDGSTLAGDQLATYVRIKAVGAHDAAGPSEVPTEGHDIVDAGIAWRLTGHVELRGALRNLLNEAYQSSAGPRWVWAPGRHGVTDDGRGVLSQAFAFPLHISRNVSRVGSPAARALLADLSPLRPGNLA